VPSATRCAAATTGTRPDRQLAEPLPGGETRLLDDVVGVVRRRQRGRRHPPRQPNVLIDEGAEGVGVTGAGEHHQPRGLRFDDRRPGGVAHGGRAESPQGQLGHGHDGETLPCGQGLEKLCAPPARGRVSAMGLRLRVARLYRTA
jgi:hypothetical protein